MPYPIPQNTDEMRRLGMSDEQINRLKQIPKDTPYRQVKRIYENERTLATRNAVLNGPPPGMPLPLRILAWFGAVLVLFIGERSPWLMRTPPRVLMVSLALITLTAVAWKIL